MQKVIPRLLPLETVNLILDILQSKNSTEYDANTENIGAFVTY